MQTVPWQVETQTWSDADRCMVDWAQVLDEKAVEVSDKKAVEVVV